MGTTILLFEDRVVIETLHHEKHSLQNIADYLGFSKTTIFIVLLQAFLEPKTALLVNSA